MKKSVSYVLLATILLQSCVAYQKTSVSVQEAHYKDRVMAITSYDKKVILRYVTKIDNSYYGVRLNDGVLIRIDSTSNVSLYPKDIKRSRNQTRLLIGGIVLSFVVTAVVGIAIATKMAVDATYAVFVSIAAGGI